MNRTRTLLAATAAVAALIAGAAVATTTAAAQAPTQATITINPTAGMPGTQVTIDGTCDWPGLNADSALLRVFYTGGLNGNLYEIYNTNAPMDATQTVQRSFTVPNDAANGNYTAEIACFLQDQGLGTAETPFSVSGGIDPSDVTTTTTEGTSTTSTTSIATETSSATAPPSSPAPATPARPTTATPSYTG